MIVLLICVLCCLSEVIGIEVAQQDLTWMKNEGCSRFSSRLVRNFLDKEVYSRLPFPAKDLPRSCQLNPSYDRFLQQEKNKTELNRGDYSCNICGKHFKSEYYLDKHMHNMHTDVLLGGDQGMCLGELCPLFGCSSDLESQLHQFYKSGRSIPWQKRSVDDTNVFDINETCTPASLERQTYKCENLMRKCFVSSNVPGNFQLEV